ncbi:hypothetical protein ACT691_08975 [Vibrio metschnikovii]
MFDVNEDGDLPKQEYGIEKRYLRSIMSPWAAKRLHEFGGDITKFKVVKVRPSIFRPNCDCQNRTGR